MLGISRDEFIRDYARAIRSNDASAFVGAGMSQPSGFVNWRDLLREVASDINLDIEKEDDLVGLAQFHVNERNSRGHLNQKLIQEFTKEAYPSENHRILARLPLSSIWTTNYDKLIEDSMLDAGRRPDVKVTQENLAQTMPSSDITIYKMHGDVGQPQNAVLTRDDYESYEETRGLFSEKLKGDLISKTFLFVGFSFSDPNIDYILSRIRVLLGRDQRTHYCIMKRPNRPTDGGKSRAEYEYESRKLELRIADLQRFNIQTILISDYDEITSMLFEVSKRTHARSVFISGSAFDAGAFGADRLRELSKKIGRALVENDYKLISGFGRGVGEDVVIGALQGVYGSPRGVREDSVVIRPFMRANASKKSQEEMNTKHREDLISQAGAVIFICGNSAGDGSLVNASGVLEEYEIARRFGRFPIPIGCTGYAAREIWERTTADYKSIFPMSGIIRSLKSLGGEEKSDEQIVDLILDVLAKTSSFRS